MLGFKDEEDISAVRVFTTNGKLEGVWANSKFHKARQGEDTVRLGSSVDELQIDMSSFRGEKVSLDRIELVRQEKVATSQENSSFANQTENEPPLISVIIPSYNRAHCIFSSLASVFSQTRQDFEVLLVDDSSTDNTEGETLWFRNNFPGKLRFLRLDHNQGESFARNVGFQASRGKYIACLDSDDQWEPTYLEKMVAKLEGSGADLVWSFVSFFTVLEDGSLLPEKYPWVNLPDQIRNPQHNRIWLGPQHCVYHRRWFLGYDEDVDKAEDAELYERMLAQGAKFACLPEPLVRILHHTDSQNRSRDWTGNDRWRKRRESRNLTRAIERPWRASFFSLAMPVWNRTPLVRETIENLQQTIDREETPYELILIDNGSNDGTEQWLNDSYEDLVLQRHKVLFNGWNAGIPNALNQALLLKEGDVFLHAASDIRMEEGWLSRLSWAFNRYPDLAVSGVAHRGISDLSLHREEDYPGLLFPPDDAAIGPALSFPEDVAARVGYFNAELGKYGREDTLFCRRARAAGYRVAYVDGTRCQHLGESLSPAGRTEESERKRKMLEGNKAYTLHYTGMLAQKEEAYIHRQVNPLFSLSPGASVSLGGIPFPPSQVALCFTLRSDKLSMVDKAVESCVSNTQVPLEVVFVCNNARREVVEWALAKRRTLMSQGILAHVLNYAGNWGIAKAYNAALACTWAPFLATVNDDVVAGKGWLERLLESACLSNTGYVCSNTTQHHAYLKGDFSVQTPEAFPPCQKTFATIEAKKFVGFASLVQRNKLAEVGPFDTSAFVYHAETDMAARLGIAGYHPIHRMDSFVLHLRAGTTAYAERSLRNLAYRHIPPSLRSVL